MCGFIIYSDRNQLISYYKSNRVTLSAYRMLELRETYEHITFWQGWFCLHMFLDLINLLRQVKGSEQPVNNGN